MQVHYNNNKQLKLHSNIRINDPKIMVTEIKGIAIKTKFLSRVSALSFIFLLSCSCDKIFKYTQLSYFLTSI